MTEYGKKPESKAKDAPTGIYRAPKADATPYKDPKNDQSMSRGTQSTEEKNPYRLLNASSGQGPNEMYGLANPMMKQIKGAYNNIQQIYAHAIAELLMGYMQLVGSMQNLAYAGAPLRGSSGLERSTQSYSPDNGGKQNGKNNRY